MKRSKWKGLFIETKEFKKVTSIKKEISRHSTIAPKFVAQNFQIHNGNKFKNIIVTKEMLGHKFGELSRTRATFEYKKKKKKKK